MDLVQSILNCLKGEHDNSPHAAIDEKHLATDPVSAQTNPTEAETANKFLSILLTADKSG